MAQFGPLGAQFALTVKMKETTGVPTVVTRPQKLVAAILFEGKLIKEGGFWALFDPEKAQKGAKIALPSHFLKSEV